MSRVFVPDGNRFIGRELGEIGRLAVVDGHEINSLLRSGLPAVTELWVGEIKWITATLFTSDHWRDHLDGCNASIHTDCEKAL